MNEDEEFRSETSDERLVREGGEQTLDRLRALVLAGFQIDLWRDTPGQIWLLHPRKDFEYRQMIVGGGGWVWWQHNEGDRCYFEPTDNVGFARFLERVPRPPWWLDPVFRVRMVLNIFLGIFAAIVTAVVVLAVDYVRG
jgi:hypothetical protein